MRAAAGRVYLRVLAWDARCGALLTERLARNSGRRHRRLSSKHRWWYPYFATPGAYRSTVAARSRARRLGCWASWLSWGRATGHSARTPSSWPIGTPASWRRQSGRSSSAIETPQLADLADADPEHVWRWGFVERVTTGLYLRWFGHASESATFLDTAAQLAG